MKTSTRICMVFSLVLMLGGLAFANGYDCPPGNGTCVATTWSETFNPILLVSNRTFNFDLTHIYPTSYNPATDKITSAELTLDVNGYSYSTTYYYDLLLGNTATPVSFHFTGKNGNTTYDIIGSLLVDLQQDGKFTVKFDDGTNCPDLDWIKLTASGFENCPTTVPEPSTMLLFGAGLIGVGILRRRTSKK